MRRLLPFLLVLVCGCGAAPDASEPVASSAPAAEAPASKAEAAVSEFDLRAGNDGAAAVSAPVDGKREAPKTAPRAIIRHGSVTLRVDKLAAGEKSIRRIAAQHGGWIDALDGDTERTTATLRIPSESFDRAMEEVLAIGSMMQQSVDQTDVTDQIVDIGARMKALRAEEAAYIGMLAQTRNLNDTLTVRERLGAVRQLIEQADASRTNLSRQAAMSTLEITLMPVPVAKPQGDDPGWFAASLADAVGAFGSAARAVLGVLMYVVVFSPFWLPFAWIAWRNRRKVFPAIVKSAP